MHSNKTPVAFFKLIRKQKKKTKPQYKNQTAEIEVSYYLISNYTIERAMAANSLDSQPAT